MNITLKVAVFSLVAALWSVPAAAQTWEPSQLAALKQGLATKLVGKGSAGYDVTEGEWTFSSECDAEDCYGTNPDSPYGLPLFGGAKSKRLKPTDAIVVLMETPPPSKYFGVTPYIYSRYYQGGTPSAPGPDITVPVFQSLTDTVNHLVVGTAGSLLPGGAPFSELAVFVMTADSRTYADVVGALGQQGFPLQAINRAALPMGEVPLEMGVRLTDDTFSIVSRTAYPEDPAALSDYMSRNPVAVLHLSPNLARSVEPLPVPPGRIPGTGVPEPALVAAQRDALVRSLVHSYLPEYTVSERIIRPKQTSNYVCVDWGLQCDGDNPDAIYTSDIDGHVPQNRKDKILIVGVNHRHLNKATYFSHSLVDPSNSSGIVAVGDQWVEENEGPGNDVYWLTISYDCENDPRCLTIPEPTASDSLGLPFGAPFRVTGRTYLDPATKTRPAISELIVHRVFLLTKRRP